MKPLSLVCVCMVGLLALSLFPSSVSAYTATVDAMDVFAVDVEVFPSFDLTYDWTSDRPLSFTITGPGGVIRSVSATTSASGSVEVTDWGTYTLTWANSGALSASLDYTYSMDPLQAAEDWWDRMLTTLIIIVVIVVIIIVVVVMVVVYAATKKAPPQGQMAYPPPQAYGPPAATTGVCPMCGTPVDPNFQFCAKCGARTK